MAAHSSLLQQTCDGGDGLMTLCVTLIGLQLHTSIIGVMFRFIVVSFS
jgi:hypothetical protein